MASLSFAVRGTLEEGTTPLAPEISPSRLISK
jgi:hypothetical protein